MRIRKGIIRVRVLQFREAGNVPRMNLLHRTGGFTLENGDSTDLFIDRFIYVQNRLIRS